MHRFRRSLAAAAAIVLLGAGAAAADDTRYQVTNLVSDIPGLAARTDARLVNPWGVAFNPNGFVWVADNGSNSSTLYDGNGNPSPTLPFVNVPGPPTGIVFNATTDFKLSGNAAAFIFAIEDGSIAAWSPAVDLHNAITVVPSTGGVYKGLAIAGTGGGHFLYAANFLAGRIDVFDASFHPVTTMPFRDPGLPPNFSPFNIANINGDLYVAYAERLGNDTDETAGRGLGFVDVFDANGVLIRRLVSRGALNAPWAMVVAPASFGKFGGRLLVGNFGDGAIDAYDLASGEFKGQLRGTDNKPLRIDGLWGLAFGNGLLQQPADTLFFAAGLDGEMHGLYGAITPVGGPPDGDKD